MAALAMRGQMPITGPVRLRLTATMPVAPSWPARRREAALAGEIRPTGRPDNITKAAPDALNGIVVDAQVVEITAEKRYGAEPGVVIEVEAIDG